MAQSLIQQDRHVRVIQPVHRLAAAASTNDKIEIPQNPQLLRYRRLRHLHRDTQVTDTARTLAQATKDQHPAGRSKSRHQPRDLLRPGSRQACLGRDPVNLSHARMFACTSLHVKPDGGWIEATDSAPARE